MISKPDIFYFVTCRSIHILFDDYTYQNLLHFLKDIVIFHSLNIQTQYIILSLFITY